MVHVYDVNECSRMKNDGQTTLSLRGERKKDNLKKVFVNLVKKK